MLKYADDKVPNIKVMVLTWMLKCRDNLKSKFRNEFHLFANKLKNDQDEDVK